MPDKIPVTFEVQIYGELHPYSLNPSKSVARVRTYYKGINRNHTNFNDAVATYINEHMVGNPIIGFYDTEKNDFTQHWTLEKTKAYGHVPNPANFAWEKHLDKDGVEREYACFDIVLYTDRYPEASKIPGAAHSMEVNPKTSCGTWAIVNGEYVFNYSFAEVYGLCVLGKTVEPCFEGASFYSLDDPNEAAQFMTLLGTMKEEIKKNFSMAPIQPDNGNDMGGILNMPIKFNVAEDSNFELLFKAMNPDYTEEKGYAVDYLIHSVTDDSFCAYACKKDGKNLRVKYTMEDGTVTLGESVEVSVNNFTADELTRENESKVSKEDYEARVSELNAQIDTLNAQVAEFTASDYQNQIVSLTAERDALKQANDQFTAQQNATVAKQKDDLIEGYTRQLSEEEMAPVVALKDSFSLDELDSKLAVIYRRKVLSIDGGSMTHTYNNQQDAVLNILKTYKQGE